LQSLQQKPAMTTRRAASKNKKARFKLSFVVGKDKPHVEQAQESKSLTKARRQFFEQFKRHVRRGPDFARGEKGDNAVALSRQSYLSALAELCWHRVSKLSLNNLLHDEEAFTTMLRILCAERWSASLSHCNNMQTWLIGTQYLSTVNRLVDNDDVQLTPSTGSSTGSTNGDLCESEEQARKKLKRRSSGRSI